MLKTLTPSDIKEMAPSVFSTDYSKKLSEKYSFVPTFEVLENFEREGWTVTQANQIGRGNHASHQVRLTNGGLTQVGDSIFQAVIKNSHNGLKALTVGGGLYRLVCSNGLTLPSSAFQEFNFRHKNLNLDDVRRITDNFAKQIPLITNSVKSFENREMSIIESQDFMTKATMLRWDKGSLPKIDVNTLLNPNRDGDVGSSLWKVFNVAQEKLVRGGEQYRSQRGRLSSVRELKNFERVNQLNTKLWELAESYI